MKYRPSITRIALYMKMLYLQKFSKALMHYVILAIIFIASTSLFSIAFTFKVPSLGISELLIFAVLPKIFQLVILLFISKSFAEFHDRRTSSLLLTVPASSLEKYLGIFLFYFLSHVVLGTIILSVSQLLAGAITKAILHYYHESFNLWRGTLHSLGYFKENEGMLSHIASELGDSFHTIIKISGYFFLTALLFKKHQFIKTILIVWALYSLYAMFMFIIYIVQFTTQSDISHQFLENDSMSFQENIFMIGSFACIIIGYFRFSKMQYS